MTPELQFLLLVGCASMLATFLTALKATKPAPQPKSKPEPKVKQKKKPQHDEVIDTLDWMLANHIITPQEYTKLMGKCLQYL